MVSPIAPVLMLVVAVLSLGQAVRQVMAIDEQWPAVPFFRPGHLPVLGGPAAATLAWLAVVLLTATGRVVTLLASGPVLDLVIAFGTDQTVTLVIVLGNALLALLVWPVAIASRKRRPQRA